eukprot:TRINITY_DN58182_c0_g1_i1.p1 TRINITY_DN58182_c0_g1~~TRINITY_DN58182_c0_g1_i1.p1  ORF type:complete len:1117 (-),score=208.12 TRINITY_DN58182_c0_g1_i1:409-3759(-)
MTCVSFIILSTWCVLAHAVRYELASFDLFLSNYTDSYVYGDVTPGVGSATFSRTGVADDSVLFGALGGQNFSTSAPPAPAVDANHFDLTLSAVNLQNISDLYIYFAVVHGVGAPSAFAVTSSMDGFATTVSTFNVSSMSMTDVMVRVPTSGPVPASITVRFTAADAASFSGDGSHVAFKNHMALGRAFVFAAPLHCPEWSADACQHGSIAYRSWVANSRMAVSGLCDHKQYGTWQCELLESPLVVLPEFILQNDCWCNCYTSPLPYDPCAGTSLSSPLVGTVCAGATVVSPADVGNLSSCDTISGDLTIRVGGIASFPRLRRIHGTLNIEGGTTRVEMPMLEVVLGIFSFFSSVTALELPRLQDMCGGSIDVTYTSMSTIALPSLGPRPMQSISVTGTPMGTLDVGSVGGGPRALTGKPGPAAVLKIGGNYFDPLTTVRGFAALEEVHSYPGSSNAVTFLQLAGDAALFEWLGNVSIGGAEGEGYEVSFTMQNIQTSRNLTLQSVHGVTSVSLVRVECPGLFFPNIQGVLWETLYVYSQYADMKVVDFGGGPLAIEAASTNFLTLMGDSGFNLVIQGLSRLQRIAGRVGQNDVVKLQYLNGLPDSLRNVQFDAETRQVKLQMRTCELPSVVEIHGVVRMAQLYVTECFGVTTLSFPNMAGTTGDIEVFSNLDLSVLDFGANSGGPTTIRGSGMSGTYALKLGGHASRLLGTVTGLSNLALVESEPNMGAVVRLTLMSAFPSPLLDSAFGSGANAISLSIEDNVFDLMGEVVFSAMASVKLLVFRNNKRITALRVPHLAGDATCIEVSSCEYLHAVDFGSVSGGPTRLRGLGPSHSQSSVLRLKGFPATPITSIQGLDNLAEVSCDRVCTVLFSGLTTFPSSLMSVSYAPTGEPISFYLWSNEFSAPIALTFPGVGRAYLLIVSDNIGVTAAGFPNLGTETMSFIDVHGNPSLASADLGSSGGGPTSLTGKGSTYALRIEGSAGMPVEMVTGLANLTTFAVTSTKVVNVAFVGASSGDLADALQRSTCGAGSCSLYLESAPWTSLIFTAATHLKHLKVVNFPALADLKFPMVGANLITGTATITGNPSLPDGCATVLDPQVAGTLTASGLLAGTACP